MTDRNERRPGSADKTVGDIRRATRRKFSAEEKIRIVLVVGYSSSFVAPSNAIKVKPAVVQITNGASRTRHAQV